MKASDFVEVRTDLPEGTRACLLHTRYDTKGSPDNNDNNHPVITDSVFVTHNGSISNDDDVFKSHKLNRKAEVDSEAISAIINKYGLDNSEKALSELEGAFAIAAIDPINHPDTLVLAKAGGWTPLVYHESDKFLVWASYESAITDAWKIVLGTPPAHRTFNTLGNGELLVVTPNGIEKRKFEPKRTLFTKPHQTTTTTRTSGRTTGPHTGQSCALGENWNRDALEMYESRLTRDREVHIERTVSSSNIARGRYKDAARVLREKGHGRTTLWMLYHEGRLGKEELAALPKPLTWRFCGGCLTVVGGHDMRETLGWGEICEDCYTIAVANLPHHKNNPANLLDEDEKRVIENWSVMESEVHRLTLREVSDITTLDTDTIDYLIFRADKNYLEQQPKMGELAEKLDDLYQEALEAAWEGFGVKDAERLRPSPLDEEGRPITGSSGSTEPPSLSPPALLPGSIEVEGGLSWMSRFSPAEEAPKRHKMILAQRPDLSITSCCTCKHRTKWHMLNFAWCGKHYHLCHGEKCPANQPDAPEWQRDSYKNPHCTTPDGRRLCHHCSKGEKGLLYDSQLERLGVEVAERTSK